GVTNSRQAEPGTIRGDFGQSVQCNLIHASDSVETAKAEVARFFKKEEIVAHGDALLEFTYSADERG
ncbi:MAG: nucleoside-diphosphate kinase, partial [Candidatus Micrarchaeota archaeon]|nr:nucleoside-diphosphate kinase [Candidatus Micrarchaeota archaeon]